MTPDADELDEFVQKFIMETFTPARKVLRMTRI
jgi:hypothetical protein